MPSRGDPVKPLCVVTELQVRVDTFPVVRHIKWKPLRVFNHVSEPNAQTLENNEENGLLLAANEDIGTGQWCDDHVL